MTSRPRNKITNLRPSFSALKCADICAQVFISVLQREYFKRAVFGILLSQRSPLRLERSDLPRGTGKDPKEHLMFYKHVTKHFLAPKELIMEVEDMQSVNQRKVGGKKDSPRSLQNVLLDICLSPEPTVEVFLPVCWDQDLIFFMPFAPIYFIYPSPFTFFSSAQVKQQ